MSQSNQPVRKKVNDIFLFINDAGAAAAKAVNTKDAVIYSYHVDNAEGPEALMNRQKGIYIFMFGGTAIVPVLLSIVMRMKEHNTTVGVCIIEDVTESGRSKYAAEFLHAQGIDRSKIVVVPGARVHAD